MAQDLPATAGIDYAAFAFPDWTPGRVIFCLMHWADLEQAAMWGIEGGEWPPPLGDETTARCYPANMTILATKADLEIAVRSLPPRQGAAVVAYYKRGHTQQVIAEGLRCSQQNVGKTLRRGERGIMKKLCEVGL